MSQRTFLLDDVAVSLLILSAPFHALPFVQTTWLIIILRSGSSREDMVLILKGARLSFVEDQWINLSCCFSLELDLYLQVLSSILIHGIAVLIFLLTLTCDNLKLMLLIHPGVTITETEQFQSLSSCNRHCEI